MSVYFIYHNITQKIYISVILWPHDLSRDLVNHYIQQYFTKFTDHTYPSLYSWRLNYLIYQPVILLQFQFLLTNILFVGT